MSKRMTFLARASLVMALFLVFAACGTFTADAGDVLAQEDTTTTQVDTTVITVTTPSVPPTTGGGGGGGGNGLIWFAVLVILAFLLVGILIGRNRKDPKPVPVVSDKPTFKDMVRSGYAEARWALDALSEELAIWRGNALFDETPDPGQTAGTSLADTWAQLDDRMSKATGELYNAEAAAPDANSAGVIKGAVSALNETRSAVDARAEARFNSRGVNQDDQLAVSQAAERERIASATLAESHQKLNDSLVSLSALI